MPLPNLLSVAISHVIWGEQVVSPPQSFTPAIYRDFNDGTVGQSAQSEFEQGGGALAVYANSNNPLDGNYIESTAVTGSTNTFNFGGWLDFNSANNPNSRDLVEGEEIWAQTTIRGSTDFWAQSSPHLKFMRFREELAGNNQGYADIYMESLNGSIKFIKESINQWYYAKPSGDLTEEPATLGAPVQNVWNRYEFYVKFHSSPSEGKVKVWKDDVLILDITVQTLVNANSLVTDFLLFTYWNGEPDLPNPAETVDIDNIIIANTDNLPVNTDADGNTFIGNFSSSNYIELANPEYSLFEDFEGTVDAQIGGAFTTVIDDTTGSGAGKVNKARYYPDGVQGGVGSVEGLWSETTVDLPIQAKQVVMQWDEYVPATFDTANLTNCKSVMIYSGTYGVVNSNMTMNCECWPSAGGGAINLNAGQDGINYGHSQNPDNYLMWEDNQGSWQHVTVYFEVADDASSTGRLVVMRNDQVVLDTDNLDWAPLGWVTSTYGYTTMQELIRFSTRGNFVDKLKLNGWFNTDVDDVFGGSEMAFLQNNLTVQASTTKGLVTGLPTDAKQIFALEFSGDTPMYQTESDKYDNDGYIRFLGAGGSGHGGTNISTIDVTDDPIFPNVKALRDTYFGGGTNYTFANQTLFVDHDETKTFYMRLRVKWSSDWEWGNDQLKFCKHKGGDELRTNFPKFNSSGEAYITKLTPVAPELNELNIYATYGTPDDYNQSDDIVNDFGGDGVDQAWSPTLGQWYWIEVEVDAGTAGNADGSMKMWVDGNLYMQKRQRSNDGSN